MNSDSHFAFRETQKLDRLTAFRTDSARRMTSQIERIVADFNRAINDLNRAIEAEHIRTHIDDPNHFAYSTAAKAMAQRRSNLVQSIDRLKHQLADATPPRFQAQRQIPAVASAISFHRSIPYRDQGCM